MIPITGYKQVDYVSFKEHLKKSLDKTGKTKLQVASELKLKATNSVRNIFTDKEQTGSDKLVTKVMKSAGLGGFIVWIFGKRYYYIKN